MKDSFLVIKIEIVDKTVAKLLGTKLLWIWVWIFAKLSAS